MNYSSVKVCDNEKPIFIKITSDEKPRIKETIIEKWQDIIDLISITLNVPSGLIMRIDEEYMNVFVNNTKEGNPYRLGEKGELLSGLYCETVVGNNYSLLVPNALQDPLWINNPDVKLSMISYLGFPLVWSDGEIFGTICVLDNKENYYSYEQIKLMELFKDSIEKDLKLLLEEYNLEKYIEKSKIVEQELLLNQSKYKELFNNMRSAVIIYNVQDEGKTFIFEDLNKAAELIEKVNKTDIIGKNLRSCYPSIIQTYLLNIMEKVWRTGDPENLGHIEYEDDRIKGWRDNYYIYKLSPEKIVVMYDDITEEIEYKKIIDENRKIILENKEIENLKTEFFANISHELRTPLNIILGTIQISEIIIHSDEKPIDKIKMLKNISIAKQNCLRLLRLINNLLDSTKIDSSNLELNLVNWDIINFIEEITSSVVQHINNNNLTIIFDTDIEEKIIAFDLDKIERIMLNLISNSIKFTEPGGNILVNVLDGKDFITITVEDNGIGIPKDKLNIIFDRFRQVDKSFTRKCEGSGIGLSLVKSMVEMQKGTISVESTYGIGTKFIIKFPVGLLDNHMSKVKTKFVNKSSDNLVERIKIEFSDIYKLNDK